MPHEDPLRVHVLPRCRSEPARSGARRPAAQPSPECVVPVPRRSAVNLDSVESVSVAVLVERVGRLSDDRMKQICDALEVAVACGS